MAVGATRWSGSVQLAWRPRYLGCAGRCNPLPGPSQWPVASSFGPKWTCVGFWAGPPSGLVGSASSGDWRAVGSASSGDWGAVGSASSRGLGNGGVWEGRDEAR